MPDSRAINRHSNSLSGRVCAGCETAIPPSRGGPARKWCSEKCRKAQYGGVCENCGAATDGSYGSALAPKLCRPCRLEEQTTWGADGVLTAIRRWVETYGEPPGEVDWNPNLARRRDHLHRVERYETGNWPSHATVTYHFGSWNAAIEAAGFSARIVGWNEASHRNRRPRRKAA